VCVMLTVQAKTQRIGHKRCPSDTLCSSPSSPCTCGCGAHQKHERTREVAGPVSHAITRSRYPERGQAIGIALSGRVIPVLFYRWTLSEKQHCISVNASAQWGQLLRTMTRSPRQHVDSMWVHGRAALKGIDGCEN
jgi:hypothetical protein